MTDASMKPFPCPHCGGYHKTTCARIRSIEYYQDGTVKRVELHSFAPEVTGNTQLSPHLWPRS